jgi:hypothetical protein
MSYASMPYAANKRNIKCYVVLIMHGIYAFMIKFHSMILSEIIPISEAL